MERVNIAKAQTGIFWSNYTDGCWCFGDARSSAARILTVSCNVDILPLSCLILVVILDDLTCDVSMSRNDVNCKFFFLRKIWHNKSLKMKFPFISRSNIQSSDAPVTTPQQPKSYTAGGRHHTQPITELEHQDINAALQVTPKGSIAHRWVGLSKIVCWLLI